MKLKKKKDNLFKAPSKIPLLVGSRADKIFEVNRSHLVQSITHKNWGV